MLQKFLSGLKPREKKILIVAGIVVLGFLFERLLITPTLNKLDQLEQSITKEGATIERNLSFLQNEKEVKEHLNQFSNYFAEKPRTEGEIMGDFSERLERIAQQSNINLAKSNISDTRVEDDLVIFTANVETSGNIKDVLRFLYNIDTDKSLLRVDNFTLTPKRGDASQVQSVITISKILISLSPEMKPENLVINSDHSG